MLAFLIFLLGPTLVFEEIWWHGYSVDLSSWEKAIRKKPNHLFQILTIQLLCP